jgi:hypothetical protein
MTSIKNGITKISSSIECIMPIVEKSAVHDSRSVFGRSELGKHIPCQPIII